jgi:hypothetical protein
VNLPTFSGEDIREMRERLALTDATTWADLAALWDAHESEDPKIGGPDVPHEFALRFIHKWARNPPVTPATFYVHLREAFFQAMTVVVEQREPGKRYFK